MTLKSQGPLVGIFCPVLDNSFLTWLILSSDVSFVSKVCSFALEHVSPEK